MPTRILRNYCDSDRFDGLSAEAERLFVRLLQNADDYGRFHAESRRVKAACFLLADDMKSDLIDQWLAELVDRDLVIPYEVEGRKLLVIPRFDQRMRQSRAKFPPPPGKADSWLPSDDTPTTTSRDSPEPAATSGELSAGSGKSPELAGTGGDFRPDLDLDSDLDLDLETKTTHAAAPPSPVSSTKTKKPETPPELPVDLTKPAMVEAWAKWLDYRREKRKPVSATAACQLFDLFRKWGVTGAVDSIRTAIANDWQGLQPPRGPPRPHAATSNGNTRVREYN